MFTAFLLLTLLLAVLTLLPLVHVESWLVRILDFPRLQIVFLALAMLILELALLDLAHPAAWVLLAATAACLLYQAWWIFPYTPFKRVEVKPSADGAPGSRLRLLAVNVLTGNRNSRGLLALVRENAPDLIVTLESNAWWEDALRELEKDYPHTIKCPLENRYGMHVYSRYPLSQSSIEYLLEEDIPSIHTVVHLPCGTKVAGHFLHPRPPSPPESASSSKRDAELVIVGRSVAGNTGPVIVAGDLNDVAWSRTTRLFRKISGLLDPRVGRGMFNTFHAGHWFMRWPLDHLFHSSHFRVRRLCRLPYFGSDHFPLFSELVLVGEQASHRGPEAEAEDHAMAQDKAASEGVSASEVPKLRT